jgi:hypothetical protein
MLPMNSFIEQNQVKMNEYLAQIALVAENIAQEEGNDSLTSFDALLIIPSLSKFYIIIFS